MKKILALLIALCLTTAFAANVSAAGKSFEVTGAGKNSYFQGSSSLNLTYYLSSNDYSGNLEIRMFAGTDFNDTTVTVKPNTAYTISIHLSGNVERTYTPGTKGTHNYTLSLYINHEEQLTEKLQDTPLYTLSVNSITVTEKGASAPLPAVTAAPTATPAPASTPATPAASATTSPDASGLSPATATPTASTCLVNGKPVAFGAYNIGGNNYFKLRDLAYSLRDTSCMFSIDYDTATNTISISNWQPYTPAGGELAATDGKAKTAVPTTSKVLLDGKEIRLTAYNIDGSNYFKLRDFCAALTISVNYDAATNTIRID